MGLDSKFQCNKPFRRLFPNIVHPIFGNIAHPNRKFKIAPLKAFRDNFFRLRQSNTRQTVTKHVFKRIAQIEHQRRRRFRRIANAHATPVRDINRNRQTGVIYRQRKADTDKRIISHFAFI